VPDAHNGVHGVVSGDRIHTDPFNFHFCRPVGEIG
jgi:hypothetical protein